MEFLIIKSKQGYTFQNIYTKVQSEMVEKLTKTILCLVSVSSCISFLITPYYIVPFLQHHLMSFKNTAYMYISYSAPKLKSYNEVLQIAEVAGRWVLHLLYPIVFPF